MTSNPVENTQDGDLMKVVFTDKAKHTENNLCAWDKYPTYCNRSVDV